MKLRNILGTAGICLLAAFSTSSQADLLFQLTSDHCTGGCLTNQQSAGQIVVHDNGGGSLSFTVTLFNSNQFINTGFPVTFGFSLSGNPTITYSSLTAGFNIPNVIPVNQQAAGAYQVDGFGDFEYGVLWHLQGGGSGTPGPLSFTIAAAGLSLASLEASGGGGTDHPFFAVDILSGTTGFTGPVDASTGTVCTPPVCNPQAPEPATLALLGIALLAMSLPAIRRRRHYK